MRFGLKFLPNIVVLAAFFAAVRPAMAWSHQGHILLTRLACLRIMDDPAAPAGLKAFLQDHMKADRESCRRLALESTVGPDPQAYQAGLDNWCTMPDRVKHEAGAGLIAPFNAPEAQMHYCDLELFSSVGAYKDDLSGKPQTLPHDPQDPRYGRAGYAPLRIADVYGKLVAAFGPGPHPADDAAALQWAGYLAHYVEDSTQPQHATVDFRSLSYLAGHNPAVHAVTHAVAGGATVVEYRVTRGMKIDPHGDLEYQLFENAAPPRQALRQQYWQMLQEQLDAPTAPATEPATAFDPFAFAQATFFDSYDCLPLVGRAAQAGHATEPFDIAAFFGARGTVRGQEMSTLEMLSRQNAKAVLAVEKIYRQAWAQAHR